MNDIYVHIDGIFCEHCVETIKLALGRLEGVQHVSLKQNVAKISGNDLPSASVIAETIKNIGYETDESKISNDISKVSRGIKLYEFLVIAAVILLVVFAIRQLFGYNIFNAIPSVDSSLSYGMLFVTGLLTGIHCISMCGAIGIFASYETNSVRSIKRPVLYNAGRVISYTIIGGIVGLIGSAFNINLTLKGIIILIAAVFMLFMALSMLGLFRFKLPQFFSIHLEGKKTGAFILGLLNGLMPCGPLQAMQVYALSTGSFFKGALAMAMFALGTVPLMLASGTVLNMAKPKVKTVIAKIASVLMLILALSMLNRGLLSFGIDIKNIVPSRYENYAVASVDGDIQRAEFDLEYDTYKDILLQKGIPASIVVHADAGKITGCNNELMSKDLGFDIQISPGDNIIEFTPLDEGEYVYSCWMNMISNNIKVVDDINNFN